MAKRRRPLQEAELDDFAGAARSLRVVNPAEAEEAAFVVCGFESGWPDDVWTTCCDCGNPICHRPHAPRGPAKICMRCALVHLKDDLDPQIMVTPTVAQEVRGLVTPPRGSIN